MSTAFATTVPSCVVVDSMSELRSRFAEWRTLLRNSREANVFQSPEWFEPFWKHAVNGRELRFLFVNAPANEAATGEPLAIATPIGLMPLIQFRRLHRSGPLRVITYPLDNWGTFYGPIGDNPRAVLSATLAWLVSEAPDWDLFELDWVREGESLEICLETFAKANLPVVVERGDPVSFIDLRGTWDDYWRSRTSKWRNNVRRSEKKLGELGPLEMVHIRPGNDLGERREPCWEIYDQCESVSRASWQSSSTTGTTLAHACANEMLRDVHQSLTDIGAVSMHLLKCGGKPIAFAYNYVWNGAVYGLRAGFDPDFAQFSPGSVLLGNVIRDCFARRDSSFDLGESPADYKRFWRNQLINRFRIRYHRPGSVFAQALRFTSSLKSWFGRSR